MTNSRGAHREREGAVGTAECGPTAPATGEAAPNTAEAFRSKEQEGPYDRCLWALVYAQMDWRAASDLQRAYRIRADIRCKRCEGTGNELMFMYRQCPACKGTGVSRGNEREFAD